jgi:hypothetical protein
MLTPADEYLTHQTPYTFDSVFTSDRNFYDRYFFNGYRRDGEVYFAVAMGLYPNLGVHDAAISVVHKGKQRVLRASKALGDDRLDSKVGPISIQVVEPYRKIRLKVAKNAFGITGDLLFEARSLPCEEPHFLRRTKSGLVAMDYTRMTQHGAWSGKLSLDGQVFDLSQGTWWGCRDHSWGVRNVGGRDPRGAPPTEPPQFFWNWAPCNFADLCTLFTSSEYSDGTRWHQSGVILTPYPDATATDAEIDHDLVFKKGTRHLESATLYLRPKKGKDLELLVKPLYSFLMKGIGYGEPKWGHGMWVGPNEVDGTEFDLSKEDPMANLHVQQVSEVTCGRRKGIGIYEIIAMGPVEKYGLKGLMDPAG